MPTLYPSHWNLCYFVLAKFPKRTDSIAFDKAPRLFSRKSWTLPKSEASAKFFQRSWCWKLSSTFGLSCHNWRRKFFAKAWNMICTWTRRSSISYKMLRIQHSNLLIDELALMLLGEARFFFPCELNWASSARYESWEYSSSIVEFSSSVIGSNKWAWTPRFKIKSNARTLQVDLGELSISFKEKKLRNNVKITLNGGKHAIWIIF